MNPLKHKSHVGWTLALLLSSCTVGPDYQAPKIKVPPEWRDMRGEASTTQPATQPSQIVTGELPLVKWWTTFDDPLLTQIINQAIAANLDLRQAQERVVEARWRRYGTGAAQYPEVDLDGAAEHARLSKNGIPLPPTGGTSSGVSPLVARPGQPSGPPSAASTLFNTSELNLYQVGFDASWEIDIFGGVRRSIQASDADLAAAVEDRRDVMVTLLAEVARNYIDLRGYQKEIQIARDNLASQRQTLDLTRLRRDKGFSTDVDVTRAASQVATTQSQLPALYAQCRQSQHALAVLLGIAPEQFPPELSGAMNEERPIPHVPERVPVGLPSELLRRRPDIRRAEFQLAAATARIGVATADLYPKFSLTGSFGFQSLKLSQLAEYDSRDWAIGPAVSWPIFDFGRIRGNIGIAGSQQRQALARYQSAILGALRDVEDSMAAYSSQQLRRSSLADAVMENRQTVDLAQRLYNQGSTDFLSVLDAERSLFASEDALAQSDRMVATDLVALYKALGGGWEIEVQAK